MKPLSLLVLPLICITCGTPQEYQDNYPDNTIVRIETIHGNIDLILYNETPKHRDNFVKLIKDGFYDDLLFHRVIQDFMIQGGDPGSRNADQNAMPGSGGPGYTIPSEIQSDLFHKKGALAAARLGDNVNPLRESSGSQFYIVQGTVFTENQLKEIEQRINNDLMRNFHSQVFSDLEAEYLRNNQEPDYSAITEKANQIVTDNFTPESFFRYTETQRDSYINTGGSPHLDGSYTVFGETIGGFDVIDKIASVPTGPGSRPVQDVKMKIRILRK